MPNDRNYVIARDDGSLPPVRCPRCGELNSPKADVCAVCGAIMPEVVVATDGDEAEWVGWDENAKLQEELGAGELGEEEGEYEISDAEVEAIEGHELDFLDEDLPEEEIEDDTTEIEPVETDDSLPIEYTTSHPMPPVSSERAITAPKSARDYLSQDDLDDEPPKVFPVKAVIVGGVLLVLMFVALRPASPPAIGESKAGTHNKAPVAKEQPTSAVSPTTAAPTTPAVNATAPRPNEIEVLPPGVEGKVPALPLSQAAQAGDNETLKKLLAAGGDANEKGEKGRTPLMHAAENGRTDTLQLLLDSGADVKSTTSDGETALTLAVQSARAGVIPLLAARGADVNTRNAAGLTPLMVAVDNNRPEIVKALLEAKADRNATDRNGQTALQRAEAAKYADIVQILKAGQ